MADTKVDIGQALNDLQTLVLQLQAEGDAVRANQLLAIGRTFRDRSELAFWHIRLTRLTPENEEEFVRPYEYLVALPRAQQLGFEVARQQIITGGMLPDHVYKGDGHELEPGFNVTVDIVEWERPGNIARLF